MNQIQNQNIKDIKPPPLGYPLNIIGVKNKGKSLLRFCICGRKFDSVDKMYQFAHNCSVQLPQIIQSSKSLKKQEQVDSLQQSELQSQEQQVSQQMQIQQKDQINTIVESIQKRIQDTFPLFLNRIFLDPKNCFSTKIFTSKHKKQIILECTQQTILSIKNLQKKFNKKGIQKVEQKIQNEQQVENQKAVSISSDNEMSESQEEDKIYTKDQICKLSIANLQNMMSYKVSLKKVLNTSRDLFERDLIDKRIKQIPVRCQRRKYYRRAIMFLWKKLKIRNMQPLNQGNYQILKNND